VKRQLRIRALFGPLLVLGASLAVWAQLGSSRATPDAELVLIPFTPTQVRLLRTVETAVFVYAPVDLDQEVRLEELSIVVGGDVLHTQRLDEPLVGDPRFGELNALVERLPRELTESNRERRYFAEESAPEFEGAEVLDRRREVVMRWSALSEEYQAGRGRPFVQLDFPLHTDQVFLPQDPEGTRREVEIRVTYLAPDGARRTATTLRSITRLAEPLALPQGLVLAGASVHAGDLHVHSCHGEAAGACSPSGNCTAESLQLSGSFSYAQLRSQYEVLGLDWITATDHSYCINSSGEFAAIQVECAAATDASFLCLADIELSSDEVGSQIGSDLGDLLCLGLTSANHMGAHDLTARIAGGGDGFLGFCDGLFSDVLAPFTSNVATVRGQGGYPIINHPDGGEFGWNSHAATAGIEAGALHGVEIWNGAAQSGQGGHVGRWVDWLLDGRLLYAYSGSDTHDEAFAFGANHVLFDGQVFNGDNLHAALRSGRSYVSNAHVLILEAELGGSVIPMGSLHALPPGAPAANFTPRVHYNFGADVGVITMYSGKVGDASETLLCQSLPLTGQGSFSCSATLETGVNSWVRAYSESGSKKAYTNPVFFLPSSDDPLAYCTGKTNTAGCTAQVAASGVASATSALPFDVSASGVLNQRMGLLFYGYTPNYMPFYDGTLCVLPPLKRTPVQSSGGNVGPSDCSGTYSFDFNAQIQGGGDPGLVPGAQVYAQFWYRDPAAPSPAGLSNALFFSVGP
jgi:hypothetical protein